MSFIKFEEVIIDFEKAIQVPFEFYLWWLFSPFQFGCRKIHTYKLNIDVIKN